MHHTDIETMLLALSQEGIRFEADGCSSSSGALYEGCGKAAYYVPHQHPHIEIVCLMEGAMAFYINDGWRLLDSAQPRVLLPAVKHGEHYRDRNTDYRLLWVTLFPSALFFHTTSYYSPAGYSVSTKRLSVVPPMAAYLWQLSRRPGFAEDVMMHAHFHARLMECLQYVLSTPGAVSQRPPGMHDRAVEHIKEYVCHNYWEDLSLERIAGLMHYSKGHLNALFRRAEHIPLHCFINEIRLRKAYELLSNGDLMVKQVALSVGFNDPLYFSRIFRRRFGKSPSELRGVKPHNSGHHAAAYAHPIGDDLPSRSAGGRHRPDTI